MAFLVLFKASESSGFVAKYSLIKAEA